MLKVEKNPRASSIHVSYSFRLTNCSSILTASSVARLVYLFRILQFAFCDEEKEKQSSLCFSGMLSKMAESTKMIQKSKWKKLQNGRHYKNDSNAHKNHTKLNFSVMFRLLPWREKFHIPPTRASGITEGRRPKNLVVYSTAHLSACLLTG